MRVDRDVNWQVELPNREVNLHLPYHFRQGGIAYLQEGKYASPFANFLLKLREQFRKRELPFMIVPGWEGEFYLIHLKHGVYLSPVDWEKIYYFVFRAAQSVKGFAYREQERPFSFKFSPPKEAE